MPPNQHTCPVCGEALAIMRKTHQLCWAEYVTWRDGPQRPLRIGRLWPEDGGSWRSVDPEDLA